MHHNLIANRRLQRSTKGFILSVALPTAYFTGFPIATTLPAWGLSEILTSTKVQASFNLLNTVTHVAKGVLAGRAVKAGFDLFSTVKQLPSELAEIDKKDDSSESSFLTPKNKVLVENMAKAFTAVAPAFLSLGLFLDVVHPTKNYSLPLPSYFNDIDLLNFAYSSTLAQYLPTVAYLVSGVGQAILDVMPFANVYDFKYTKEALLESIVAAVAATLPSLVVAATSDLNKAGKRYWNKEKPAPTEK